MFTLKSTTPLVVLLCLVAATSAQNDLVQEDENAGYLNSLMSSMGSLSDMDWRAMVRSMVETVLSYVNPATSGVGEVSSRQFGGEMAVHFIETSPTLRHYAEQAEDYIRTFNHFFN